MRDAPEIESEVEGWVEDLGYELVELRWGGSGRRGLTVDASGSFQVGSCDFLSAQSVACCALVP